PSPHSSDRNSEALRDLPITEPLDMQQDERIFLTRRQGAQSGIEMPEALALSEERLGARLTARKLTDQVFSIPTLGRHSARPTAILGAKRVEGHVTSDTEHPRQKLRRRSQLVTLFEGATQRFVRTILNIWVLLRPPQNARDEAL